MSVFDDEILLPFEVTDGGFGPDSPRGGRIAVPTPTLTAVTVVAAFNRVIGDSGGLRSGGLFMDMRDMKFRRHSEMKDKARLAGVTLDVYLASKGRD